MKTTKKGMVFLVCGVMTLSNAAVAKMPKWESAAEKKKVDRKIAEIDRVIKKGPFQDDWDSLRKMKIPGWYQDAKFGIFIHWSLFCVPAFANEWYSRNMYQKDGKEYKHQVETYGPLTKFGYKDFAPLLTAEKFDPREWASLFKEAGAKYIVPVAEHHDGFAMYDCGFSRWTAAKMGPKRDILGQLTEAFREAGLVPGASSHRAEHWWFMNGGMKFDSDVQDPRFADFYGPAQPDGTTPDDEYLRNWLARSCELVDKYKPRLIYFDWWVGEKPEFKAYLRKFTAYYYNRAAEWKMGVVLNTKDHAFEPGTAVMDVERGGLEGIHPSFWQTDTSISWGSWGYLKNDHYKNADYLVRVLVDAVSKNGTLLLNIGPKPDGTVPEESQRVLRQMGEWLKTNGEAIYGTRPWIAFGEGPTQAAGGKFAEADVKYRDGDVRFTRRGDAVYVISLAPSKNPLKIKLLGKKKAPGLTVKSVTQLGSSKALKWGRTDGELTLPGPENPGSFPAVYKVTVAGTAWGDLRVETAGSGFTARTTIQNFDKKDVVREVSLSVGGKVVASKRVTVKGGSSASLEVPYQAADPGLLDISLSVPGLSTLSGKAVLPVLGLSGKWLFNKGDKAGWEKPGLDDSSWQKVGLPAAWEEHSQYTDDNVYGWYRKHVSIPAQWKGRTLVLPLGKIDDVDVTYFNGKKIGSTGQMPPSFKTAWDQARRYEVPAGLVRYGEDNVIAIRVFDATGGGGLYSGPLGPVEVK